MKHSLDLRPPVLCASRPDLQIGENEAPACSVRVAAQDSQVPVRSSGHDGVKHLPGGVATEVRKPIVPGRLPFVDGGLSKRWNMGQQNDPLRRLQCLQEGLPQARRRLITKSVQDPGALLDREPLQLGDVLEVIEFDGAAPNISKPRIPPATVADQSRLLGQSDNSGGVQPGQVLCFGNEPDDCGVHGRDRTTVEIVVAQHEEDGSVHEGIQPPEVVEQAACFTGVSPQEEGVGVNAGQPMQESIRAGPGEEVQVEVGQPNHPSHSCGQGRFRLWRRRAFDALHDRTLYPIRFPGQTNLLGTVLWF